MESIETVKTRSEAAEILHHLLRDPLGLAGLIIVGIIVLAALFADWITPYDPIALNIKDRLQGAFAFPSHGYRSAGARHFVSSHYGWARCLASRFSHHRGGASDWRFVRFDCRIWSALVG